MNAREELLLAMYAEAWRNIERHILVVWHSAGVVGATLAVFLLVEKEVVLFDVAIAMEAVVIAWLYGHILDAEYWFRRNIHIISNIERQFLTPADAQEIHYFFLPREKGTKSVALEHLRVQKLLAYGLSLGLLAWHLLETKWTAVSLFPYGTALVLLLWLLSFRSDLIRKHSKLEQASPGKPLNQPVELERPVDRTPVVP